MAHASPLVLNQEHIPSDGAVLIPNRLSFNDLLHLEKLLGSRQPVYLVEKDGALDPMVHSHLERDSIEALIFSTEDAALDEFKKALLAKIAAGHLVVFVPGRAQTRPGGLTTVPRAVLEYITGTGAPILPLFIDSPVDTRLTIEEVSETDFVIFAFGETLSREAATLANYREQLLAAGEAAFSQRPILKKSLAYAVLQGLKRNGTACQVIDGNDGTEIRFDKLFAAAAALSRVIRKSTDKKRVGIILPPGRGGTIANVAVLLAGKIPVNLNFTAGGTAVDSAIRQGDLDRFITADPFVRKMTRFPWPPTRQLIFIERVIPTLKSKILVWFALGKLFSASALAKLLGIPKEAEGEAVLLFTSGSSGDPKGVPLSHRNLLANVSQVSSRLSLGYNDKLLGCLPLFHSFGCTVTLWFPIIEGVDLITYPNPLETGKLAELIHKFEITFVIATPTFLRGYLRKAEKKQLATIKLMVTGAEKLPQRTAEAFYKKFEIPVLEGYGLTETSPVTNCNLPDPLPDPEAPDLPILPNHRPGSVGQVFPGIAVRITHPETGEFYPLFSSGMIWLKGPNIFEGYLDRPDLTKEVIQQGWFKTGDIGRMDEDGFLYIEGRISRFSKIGGEMVPHETVEQTISKELDLDGEAERKLAVVGIPDPAKGEAIILISAVEIDQTELRYRLLEGGMPALWVPKTIVNVDEIPILQSGKLDIKSCEKIATGE